MEPSLPYYYKILNINVDATQDSIQEAYSEAREVFHENSLASYGLLKQEEIRKALEEIELAYNILSNPEKRKEYDKEHKVKKISQETSKNIYSNKKIKIPKKIHHTFQQHFISSHYEKDPEIEDKIENITRVDGAFLKEIREYKNISLGQIEGITKISIKNLKSIEEDDKSSLPYIAYIRGFIKQYAKAIQLDPEQTARYYIENLEQKGT